MRLQLNEQSHFHDEEKVMEHYNFPNIVSHKDTHNTMIEILNNINAIVILENLQSISEDLGKYLEKSLNGALEADNDLKDFLVELKKDTG